MHGVCAPCTLVLSVRSPSLSPALTQYIFRCSLPSTIDHTMAMNSIRSQHDLLSNLIRHCLPSVAGSLYSKFMISQDVFDNVSNHSLGISDRVRTLLNCIEDRVNVLPSDFTKVVHILETEPFLESGVEGLVKSYRE